MNLTVVQRVTGLLLMIFSISMLPPSIVSLIYVDGAFAPFMAAFALTLITGVLVWAPVRNNRADLRLRDGFLIVVSFWLVLGLFGSVPLLISEDPKLSFTDAVFESMSGLTTTGATVITGLDILPPSILYYRQQLQWLGGMGIIVLAVAILPMLGIGGMQLYRAETPGPLKDSKLTPRITETAKALWYIYFSLTLFCALAYWIAGMTVFDAICHAFSTVAIGGFSTHDASIGYFQSNSIEIIAIVFMILSGANFGLHFVAWRSRSLFVYWGDSEFRTYAFLLSALMVIFVLGLSLTGYYDLGEAAITGIFHLVSFMTTTGFSTADYTDWPIALPLLLVSASFVGGCAASTAGGMKVIRALLLWKQGLREVQKLVHPNAELPVKIGGKRVQDRVISSVWGFFAAYVVLFGMLMLAVIGLGGVDYVSSFSAVAAAMNNLGPGLGEVSSNMTQLSDTAKWLLVFAMLLGRLEIFTLLVLFTPTFWRR